MVVSVQPYWQVPYITGTGTRRVAWGRAPRPAWAQGCLARSICLEVSSDRTVLRFFNFRPYTTRCTLTVKSLSIHTLRSKPQTTLYTKLYTIV